MAMFLNKSRPVVEKIPEEILNTWGVRTSLRAVATGVVLLAAASLIAAELIGYAAGNAVQRFGSGMTGLLLFATAYLYPTIHARRACIVGTRQVLWLLALNLAGLVLLVALTILQLPLAGWLAALVCWAVALYFAARRPYFRGVGLGGSYQHWADQDDPAWMEMLYGFDTATADVSGDDWERKGIEMLRQVAAKYGGEATLASMRTQLDNGSGGFYDGSSELYWLARAGIREAIPWLQEYLRSENEDIRHYAAWGLAHLGEQTGFDAIEEVLSGKAEPNESRIVYDWYECLDEVDDDRARELIEKYRDRDWTKG